MKTIGKLIITLALVVMLFGCLQERASSVKEHVIDNYVTIVGVLYTDDAGNVTIESYDGIVWDIPKAANVQSKTLTLDSFKRATKDE